MNPWGSHEASTPYSFENSIHGAKERKTPTLNTAACCWRVQAKEKQISDYVKAGKYFTMNPIQIK